MFLKPPAKPNSLTVSPVKPEIPGEPLVPPLPAPLYWSSSAASLTFAGLTLPQLRMAARWALPYLKPTRGGVRTIWLSSSTPAAVSHTQESRLFGSVFPALGPAERALRHRFFGGEPGIGTCR